VDLNTGCFYSLSLGKTGFATVQEEASVASILLYFSPGVVESTALVVWLRRQISQKAFLFNNTQQVADFVKSRPLVIIGFFQVLGSRGGRCFFNR
jgi:hypothetical protein